MRNKINDISLKIGILGGPVIMALAAIGELTGINMLIPAIIILVIQVLAAITYLSTI